MAHAFMWIVIFIVLEIDMTIIACNVTLNFTYGGNYELIPFKDIGNRSSLLLNLSNNETQVYMGLGVDPSNLTSVAFDVIINRWVKTSTKRNCYITEKGSPATCSVTSILVNWTSSIFQLVPKDGQSALLYIIPSTIASVLFKNNDPTQNKSIQVWFDAPLADYCCASGQKVIESCKCTNATCKSENQPSVTVPNTFTTNASVIDSTSTGGHDAATETTSQTLSTHESFTSSEHTFMSTDFTTKKITSNTIMHSTSDTTSTGGHDAATDTGSHALSTHGSFTSSEHTYMSTDFTTKEITSNTIMHSTSDSIRTSTGRHDATAETTSRDLSTYETFTNLWNSSEYTYNTTDFTTKGITTSTSNHSTLASTDITEISSPFSYENTSASTTAEHSSRDPGFSTSSHMNLCACRCVRVTSASPNEIEKKMHNTSAYLLLAKKNLSSYTRRLKSAEDDRLSSKTMGLLGLEDRPELSDAIQTSSKSMSSFSD